MGHEECQEQSRLRFQLKSQKEKSEIIYYNLF